MYVLNRTSLQERILKVGSRSEFDALALSVFQYQAANNSLYGRFLELLSIEVSEIKSAEAIPFLPISFFKSHIIKTGTWSSQQIFSSSGTTGQVNSQHHLRSEKWYHQISFQAFQHYYGPLENYCVLALLPSYLERSDSSLVFMVKAFMEASSYTESGFFLQHQDQLIERLAACKKAKIPVLHIGVSFALLDFAEQHPQDLSHCIIMETGGMKGRRKELTRPELHQILCEAFQCKSIHSEYGMTELISQSYSKGKGLFYPGPAKRVICREVTDPFHVLAPGKSGALNIIDLGNIDSCSFIATDDAGRVYSDGSFEVLGRLDGSEMRGCSLMVI